MLPQISVAEKAIPLKIRDRLSLPTTCAEACHHCPRLARIGYAAGHYKSRRLECSSIIDGMWDSDRDAHEVVPLKVKKSVPWVIVLVVLESL
jgi:hypothetical protein